MSHHLSQSARNTIELLQELERDKELDILRAYLTRFNLFPRTKDPSTAPIRFEELKELVKHWKLHRQRNFWKTHTTKEDLVRTLHMYINAKYPSEGELGEHEVKLDIRSSASFSAAVAVSPYSPSPPEKKSTFTLDSPRAKSIGKQNGKTVEEPRTSEAFFFPYDGDKFGQRGTYENGIIYSSRLRKPLHLGDINEETFDNIRKMSEVLGEGKSSIELLRQLSSESLSINNSEITAREIRLKQECAFSIYHFSTANGNEKKMVDEGCVAVIARLALVDDLKVKKYCAAALLNLTCDSPLCCRMIADGALLALLELAKSQDEEIRRHTSLALCRFSYDHVGQQHLIHEGCSSVILSLLNSPDEQTKESSVKAIVNIASSSGTPIAESVVQTIIKKNLKNDCTSIDFVTTALYNLSVLPGSRSKVVDEGILSNITELSLADDVHDAKADLATALCNYSGASCNLEKLCDDSILQCVEMLMSLDNEYIHEMCIIFIANLSSCQALREILFRNKLFTQLVGLGKTEHLTIQKNIALIISNMSAEAKMHSCFISLKIPPLLYFFLESGSLRTKQYALTSICNLVLNVQINKVFGTEMFLVILNQLAFMENDKVQSLCANAICNMTCDVSSHETMIHVNLFQTMIKIMSKTAEIKGTSDLVEGTASGLGSPPTEKTHLQLSTNQECALGFLCNLSYNSDCLSSLGESDVVKVLVAMFARPCKNEDTMSQCAAIIANISFEPSCLSRMVDQGCVRLVRKLMQSTSKETLLCCAIAACNLAAEAIEKTSVLSMLIDLSASQNKNIIATCATAFSKLALQEKSRSILSKTPELFPALILMMRFGVEEIQIRSATTFCYLAMERNTRTRHVWKEGTVPDFIVNSLLRINSASTKEICARALYNLLCHDEHRLLHIKDGILYALVRLARLERSCIRQLCADALYNLSCDPSMVECLMEVNVAHVITKLSDMEYSSTEIHRNLACCLMNLSSKTGVEVRLVNDGILTAISRLSRYATAMPYCAAGLYFLTMHHENCDTMTTNEYLNVILSLLRCADELQCAFALNALCNISCYTALQKKFQVSGAISETVSILAKSTNHQVQIACTNILFNISGNVELRTCLVQSNMIQSIHECFQSDNYTPHIVDGCVEIISILCDDPGHWAELIKKGAIKIFRKLTSSLSLVSKAQCAYALSQLSQCKQYQLCVVNDGAIKIVEEILACDDSSDASPEYAEIAIRCSATLRALSICKEIASRSQEDLYIISLVKRIVDIGSREASQSCVVTIYNLVMAEKSDVIRSASQELIKLLIKLSALCELELASACAIAVAHIQHSIDDMQDQTRSKVEDGMVTTLLAMVDLNPSSIQRVEIMAMTPACVARPIRAETWPFKPGSTGLTIPPCSDANWAFHHAPYNEEDTSPMAVSSFMSMLPPRIPKLENTVQDKIYGEYRVMKVHNTKCRISYTDKIESRNTSIAQAEDPSLGSTIEENPLNEATSISLSSTTHVDDSTDTAADVKKEFIIRKQFTSRIVRANTKKTSEPLHESRVSGSHYNLNPNQLDSFSPRAKETSSTKSKACNSSSLGGENQLILPKL